jgi:hypothetical protein
MSNRLNHTRPVLATKGRETESKYADRPIFIPTRLLLRAKTWQDVVDFNCKTRVYPSTKRMGVGA